MEKFRSRKFCMLLYPAEDKTHRKAIEFIKLNYDYALIEHNQDLDDNGNIKKAHTHVVVSFPNAKYNTAIAKELGITENYIEKCRSFDNALEYLVHYNDDSKHQYDIEEVQGNLKAQLKRVMLNDGKDENQKAYELIDYIENFEGYIGLADFFKWTCEQGYYDVARRSSYILIRLIDIHNTTLSNIELSKHNEKFDYRLRGDY